MFLGRKLIAVLIVSTASLALLPVSPFSSTTANASTPPPIVFEPTSPVRVVLGALASRSQNGQLVKSGSVNPFTMTGTDARSITSYQYQTDVNYNMAGAQGRESDERTPSSSSYSRDVGTFFTKANAIKLKSDGVIPTQPAGFFGSNQPVQGRFSFGAVFGPEVYSEPFVGSVGQAVSYQFYARAISDDYENYGFLVKINDGNTCTSTGYGTTSDHSILSYGRGKDRDWTTITGNIESNGCYRFRFVGGSYDATGGTVLGAEFYIANVSLGDAQIITFTQPGDVIANGSNQTVNLSVSSNAGSSATAAITLTSTTTNKCTVVSATKVLTVLSGQTGTCSIRADSNSSGSYGPATSVFRSFTIQATATKPVTSGGDLVTGNPLVCSTLTVQEGTWTSGGAAISSTAYQWRKDGVAIIGATTATYVVQASDIGSAISFSVTKTNSIGSTTANSNSVIILDARMSSLTLSTGTLSPVFTGCTFTYTANVSTSTMTVTPTLSSGSSTVTVAGSAVVSGQPSGSISLTVGANAISIVVTNGTQTSTTTLTVTYAQAPAVSVLSPTSITGTGATLQATVNANGQSTSNIRFEISTSATFASDTSTVSATPSTATGTTSTSVSASSPLLTNTTTYHVRAFATNATGTTTSSTFTFTTPAAPQAATSAAETLTATSATLNGSVISNGDNGGAGTTVIFQYSLNSDMSSAIEISPASNGTIAGGDTNSTSVSKTLTGLQTGSTYYFRVKATNSYGSNFGSILSFTMVGAPSVTANAASNVLTTSATLTGTVNANASTTTAITFRWGTSSGSLSNTLNVTPSSATGNSSTTVQANLTGLSANTQYFYKLTATNGISTTDSTTLNFTTAVDAAPSATLSAPGNSLLSQPFTVTVTFSEVVTGFASADLTTTGATSGWTAQTAQEVAASSRIFTVEFLPTGTPTAGNFTIALGVAKVKDSANQDNTAATSVIVVTSTSLLAPDISYPTLTITATQNSAITTLIPSNSGGIIASWTISAAPPTGISFSTSSGQFSGTPTGASNSANYIVTAINTTGTDTATVSISVAGLPVPIISYTPSTVSAIVGTAISTLTPTNTGEAASVWSIYPSLPAGLTLNTSTGLVSGTSSVTAASATYTVTASTTAGATATTTISVSSSASSAPVSNSAIAGLVPAFSPVTTATTGFTVTVTNYNASFTWSITVTSPATVTISSSGFVTVTGLTGQGTQATVTVTTSRTGYTTESGSVTGSTNPAPPPPNYLYSITAPTITKLSTTYVCTPGTYEFIRAAITKETPKISFFVFTLLINSNRVSQISSNAVVGYPYVAPSAMNFPATASLAQAIFELSSRTDVLPAQCEVLAFQENAVGLSNSNIIGKNTPNVTWPAILPITAATKLGAGQLNAVADIEGRFTYSVAAGTTLDVGKYSLTVTFTPKDIDNYDVVVVKNQLRVLTASTSIRNSISIQAPQQTIAIRTSSGVLKVDSEMLLGGKATAGSTGFGIEKISISGSSLTVWPMAGFSGKTSLALVQSGAGGIINIVQPLIVVPTGVSLVNVNVLDFAKPTLTWSAVQGATSYLVSANGVRVCSAVINSCTGQIPLGPKSLVSVTVTGKDLVKTITQAKVVVKANVEAASVNFDSGSSTLAATSRSQLLELARAIRLLGYTKVTIIGHTDADQGVNNKALSRDRAQAAFVILQRLLPNVSLSIAGQAASEPLASNDTEAGKAKNRRVEIRVSN